MSRVPCFGKTESDYSTPYPGFYRSYDRQHKKKKSGRAAQASRLLFLGYRAHKRPKDVHKKTIPASELTVKKPLSDQVPWTENSFPFVGAMFFSTSSLVYRDLLDRTSRLAFSVKDRFGRLVGVDGIHFLTQHKIVTLSKSKAKGFSPTIPTHSCRSERRMSTSSACLDFGLPPATPPQKRPQRAFRESKNRH